MAIENVNLGYLDDLPKEVKAKFMKVIYKLNDRGFSVQLNSSFRTFEEQFKLWQEQPELAAIPGTSLHESGLAFDFNVIDQNGKKFGKWSSPSEWESTGIPLLFNNEGMRWGGDFGFKDKLEDLRKHKIGLERDLEFYRQQSIKENPLAELLGQRNESQKERYLKDLIAQTEKEINKKLKIRDNNYKNNKEYDPIHGDLQNNDAYNGLSKTLKPLLPERQKEIKEIQDYCNKIKNMLKEIRQNIRTKGKIDVIIKEGNIGDFNVSEEVKRMA
jgi:hypothetical protein